jgi:hypothetical protein
MFLGMFILAVFSGRFSRGGFLGAFPGGIVRCDPFCELATSLVSVRHGPMIFLLEGWAMETDRGLIGAQSACEGRKQIEIGDFD